MATQGIRTLLARLLGRAVQPRPSELAGRHVTSAARFDDGSGRAGGSKEAGRSDHQPPRANSPESSPDAIVHPDYRLGVVSQDGDHAKPKGQATRERAAGERQGDDNGGQDGHDSNNRRVKRHPLLRLLGVLAGFLMLLLLAAFAVLRSDAGERWLADVAIRELAKQGLFIRYGTLDGPLPERLTLDDLTIADADGVWFEAAQISLRWHPLQLLHGRIDVALVQAIAPQLRRLPASSGKSTPSAAGGWSLPLALHVEALKLDDVLLGAPVLGRELQFSLDASALLTRDKGSAHLLLLRGVPARQPLLPAGQATGAPTARTADEQAAGASISGTAEGQVATAPMSPGRIAADISYDARALAVRIRGEEEAKGLVVSLLNIPGAPALNFSVEGEGPLNGWNGKLQFQLADTLDVDGTLFAAFPIGDAGRRAVAANATQGADGGEQTLGIRQGVESGATENSPKRVATSGKTEGGTKGAGVSSPPGGTTGATKGSSSGDTTGASEGKPSDDTTGARPSGSESGKGAELKMPSARMEPDQSRFIVASLTLQAVPGRSAPPSWKTLLGERLAGTLNASVREQNDGSLFASGDLDLDTAAWQVRLADMQIERHGVLNSLRGTYSVVCRDAARLSPLVALPFKTLEAQGQVVLNEVGARRHAGMPRKTGRFLRAEQPRQGGQLRQGDQPSRGDQPNPGDQTGRIDLPVQTDDSRHEGSGLVVHVMGTVEAAALPLMPSPYRAAYDVNMESSGELIDLHSARLTAPSLVLGVQGSYAASGGGSADVQLRVSDVATYATLVGKGVAGAISLDAHVDARPRGPRTGAVSSEPRFAQGQPASASPATAQRAPAQPAAAQRVPTQPVAAQPVAAELVPAQPATAHPSAGLVRAASSPDSVARSLAQASRPLAAPSRTLPDDGMTITADFDLAGTGVRWGVPALEHTLGAAPGLTGTYTYDGGVSRLEKLVFKGRSLHAGADVVLKSGGGALRIQGDATLALDDLADVVSGVSGPVRASAQVSGIPDALAVSGAAWLPRTTLGSAVLVGGDVRFELATGAAPMPHGESSRPLPDASMAQRGAVSHTPGHASSRTPFVSGQSPDQVSTRTPGLPSGRAVPADGGSVMARHGGTGASKLTGSGASKTQTASGTAKTHSVSSRSKLMNSGASKAQAAHDVAKEQGERSTLRGRVALTFAEAFGSPAHLSATYSMRDSTVSVEELSGQAAGCELAGSASLIRHDAGPGLVTGGTEFRVVDWEALSKAAGVSLSGGPLRCDIRYAAPGGKQTVQMNGKVENLIAAGVRVGSLQLAVEGDDLFGSPLVTGKLVGMAGGVGELEWQRSRLDATVGLTHGTFSLLTEGPARAEVRGRYTRAGSAMTLHLAALGIVMHPENVGFFLSVPADIVLDDGLRVQDVRFALLPSGEVGASVRSGPGETRLDVSLVAIPLQILRMVTAAPLPDGTVAGSMKMHGTPSGVTGDMRVAAQGVRFGKVDTLPVDVTLQAGFTPEGHGLSAFAGSTMITGIDAEKAHATFRLPLRSDAAGIPRLRRDGPLQFDAAWRGPLAPLWRFVPLSGRTLTGRGSLSVAMQGTVDAPEVTAEAYLCNGRYRDLVLGILLEDITLEARRNRPGAMELLLHASDGRGGSVALEGFFDAGRFGTDAKPVVLVSRVAGSGVASSGVPVPAAGAVSVPLAPSASGMNANVSGKDANASAKLPAMSGGATAAPMGLIAAPMSLSSSTSQGATAAPMQPASGSGVSGSGISGNGISGRAVAGSAVPGVRHRRVDLAAPPLMLGTGTPQIMLRGLVHNLRPLHRDDLEIMLSGALELSGPLQNTLLRADITVDQGRFELLDGLGGAVPSLDAQIVRAPGLAARPVAKTSSAFAMPTLDALVRIPNRFFVRGYGLNSEWGGEVRVTGTAAKPVLTGKISPLRGQLDLLSKPFVFTRGGIIFNGSSPPNPVLDLELSYSGPSITAMIEVEGTANRPKLQLVSRPPLPQSEIFAQVLFGKTQQGLSRFEELQLANAVRTFAGLGKAGSDPLGTLRKKLDLDVLQIGGGGDSGPSTSPSPGSGILPSLSGGTQTPAVSEGPTVEAGKYVMDNVYIGIKQGADPSSSGVKLEMQLLPDVNLEGTSSATSSDIGITWKKDY